MAKKPLDNVIAVDRYEVIDPNRILLSEKPEFDTYRRHSEKEYKEFLVKAQPFIDEGNFVGMPKSYKNRNEIRWYAINEFLGSKVNYHVVKEFNKDKFSGRLIRQSIIDNDMTLTNDVKQLLPKTTVEILEREIEAGKVPGERNWAEIYKRMNTYSRGNLEKIAYLNGNTINEIIKRRVYRDPESIWAVFRRSDYGPVMTRLAISAIEMDVSKKEVMDLMKSYEEQGVIPDNQKVQRVIDRAWYVASEGDKGVSARDANEAFRSKNINVNAPSTLEAGLNLTKFETKITKEGLDTDLYVDKTARYLFSSKVKAKRLRQT
jgi:predicted nucleotidyltransferase